MALAPLLRYIRRYREYITRAVLLPHLCLQCGSSRWVGRGSATPAPARTRGRSTPASRTTQVRSRGTSAKQVPNIFNGSFTNENNTRRCRSQAAERGARQEAAGKPAQGLDQDPEEVAVRPPLQRLPQRRREARPRQGGRPHRAPGRQPAVG